MKPDRASVVMPNSLSWVPLHGMPELSGPHQFNLRCMQVTKAVKMWPKRVSRLCRALRLKDNMTTCAPRRMYYWNWWANYCYRPSNFTHWGTKAPSPSHRRDFPDVLSLSPSLALAHSQSLQPQCYSLAWSGAIAKVVRECNSWFTVGLIWELWHQSWNCIEFTFVD